MQKPNEKKREKILAVAAELFATRPFHKVLLTDVAEVAAVGKGTLYTYFKSKEDLYLTVLYAGFEKLVDQLKQCLEADETRPPQESLEIVVREFVNYAYQNPHLFALIRSVPMQSIALAQWGQKRRELTDLICAVIRRGARLGCFSDPYPELTARFVPGLVRSALLEGVPELDQQVIADHILRFLLSSLRTGNEPQPAADQDQARAGAAQRSNSYTILP